MHITADKDVNNKAMLVQAFPEHSQVPLNCDTPLTHVHSCRKGANVNSKTSSSKMTLLANHQHQVVKEKHLCWLVSESNVAKMLTQDYGNNKSHPQWLTCHRVNPNSLTLRDQGIRISIVTTFND